MSEEQFAVTITALHGAEASILVTRFLGMVFKNRSAEEISSALRRLPLLITSDVSRDAAEVLRRHLEARGATVLLESYTDGELSDGDLQTCSGPESTTTRNGAPGGGSSAERTGPDADTSYSYSRPGRRDRIYVR